MSITVTEGCLFCIEAAFTSLRPEPNPKFKQKHRQHLVTPQKPHYRHHQPKAPDKIHFLLVLLRLKKNFRRIYNSSTTITVYFLLFVQLLLLFPIVQTIESVPSSQTFIQHQGKRPGESCSQDFECVDDLICTKPERSTDSYCDCDSSRNLTWSSKIQKCVGLVNTFCTNSTTGDKLLCVDNAFCAIKPDIGVGICECTSKYSPTRLRTCELGYGYQCSNQNNENLCHKEQLLNCIDGACRCQFIHQMEYDKEIKECRMRVGEPCNPESELPEAEQKKSSTNHKFIGCVNGTKCIATNFSGKFGKCQNSGPIITVTKTVDSFPTFLNKNKDQSTEERKKKNISRPSNIPSKKQAFSTTSTTNRIPEGELEEEFVMPSASKSMSTVLKSSSSCYIVPIIMLILL